MDFYKKAIAASKIIVPIITENTLKSDWVKKEIEDALHVAEESATVVIPLFLEHGLDYKESSAISWLSVLPGPGIDTDASAETIGKELEERIHFLLSGLDRLELYSESVNKYNYRKQFGNAFELQKAHRDLCVELSKYSNGKYVTLDEIICSDIKLVSILIDMEKWKEALDEAIDSIQMLDDDISQTSYDSLKEQFAICCVECGYDRNEVQKIIDQYIKTYPLDYFNSDLCNDLIEEYEFEENYKASRRKNAYEEARKEESEETISIARYGEAVMKIFEDLINTDITEQTRGSMIEGYQRVLNYCMHLGLPKEIPSECISRIAELKETDTIDTNDNCEMGKALKVYLGQTAPGSGNYDVFISFKSEDEALARKVFGFLRQNGKDVFFSRESLPQLGKSEYEDAIYEALDHAKHFVLVGSDPEYFKTDWVSREWKYFNNKNRDSESPGNLIIVLPGEYIAEKDKLPPQLRYSVEKIKVSEFKERLLSYLR